MKHTSYCTEIVAGKMYKILARLRNWKRMWEPETKAGKRELFRFPCSEEYEDIQ